MFSPFKFIQEVKREAFKVSWPTGKETLTGAVMVHFCWGLYKNIKNIPTC